MSQVSTPTQPIPWEAQPPSVTPAKAAAVLLHWCAEKPLARRVRRAVDRVGTRHG
ncbi:hypothetical protein [Streptomyces sp. NPDC003036]|uniref:hypothetical protein n=1 Tax=Streptomyces sp. NPDC003036 TaxID=3154442 RepID=UPI0033B74EA3